MLTLWHTSFSRLADMSRISLCLMVGKPPLWHIIAWSTVNEAPQIHEWGRLGSCHPYLKQRASLKAPLWRLNPWLVVGRTESHEEAPFSEAQSMRRWRDGGSLSLINFASATSFSRFFAKIVDLMDLVSSAVVVVCVSCSAMSAASGAVIWMEFSNSDSEFAAGFIMPSPPNLAGKARMSLSRSEHICPVMAGINFCLMVVSRG